MTSERRMPLGATLMVLSIVLAGCSDKSSKPAPTQPVPQPGFVADSPVNAVRLFEWSLEYRDLDRLSSLFTGDFLFGCAASDSSGNAFQGHGFTREDQLECMRHLLAGGGAAPPANQIRLQLDQNLFPTQDGRPGKQDQTYYREIVTSLVLRIETPAESYQVTGEARFHLVRGDVASIPAELTARGIGPDPHRWYIEGWEDETSGAGGGAAASPAREARSAPLPHTLPAKMFTLCSLLALYR